MRLADRIDKCMARFGQERSLEPYNRSNPSRRYRDLIGHYRQMHREGERE